VVVVVVVVVVMPQSAGRRGLLRREAVCSDCQAGRVDWFQRSLCKSAHAREE